MNIMFYTSFEVSPQKGGTERITASIAMALQKYYDINCYSVYRVAIEPSFIRVPFIKSIKISNINKNSKALCDFIAENDIDIVINQGAFRLTKAMRTILNKFQGKHLIFVHHFNPGAELNHMLTSNIIREIKNRKTIIKNLIKLLLFPSRKWYFTHQLPLLYRQTYDNADRIVLLSPNFKKDFLAFAHIKEEDKIRTIPNALSFGTFFNMSSYNKKKKEVLIVSRLEEKQKRISLALRIWQFVEQDTHLDDWSLKIVGHGIFEQFYKDFVQKNNLRRVFFEGTQQPERYYNDASLFMLTSSFEGWGLTLTEAQQYGCIPLAFNSYASLTDIITDGENGFIIPDNDINEYTERIKMIMKNEELRKEMAQKAIESSKRFEIKAICDKWKKLLDELKS